MKFELKMALSTLDSRTPTFFIEEFFAGWHPSDSEITSALVAAAGLIDVLNGRGAGRARNALEIVLGRGVVGETDEFRRAFLGDMDVLGGIGAAHIEGCVGALGTQHSKPPEELLHHIEVGSPKPPVRDVGCLDPSHTSHVSN